VLGRPAPLVLAVALLGALALVLPGCGLLDRSADPPGAATVVHVVDGDTIDLRIGRRDETARLLGIDTPETVKPGAPVDCFGPEASARTKALLPPGTVVRLTRDVEVRDRFDRLLVYVVRERDDLFVNRALVAEGFARTLPIEPNDAHRSDLEAAEADARAERRGLWGRCPPDG
jgi:micrococcal nuclease